MRMMEYATGLALSLVLALPVHANSFFSNSDSTRSWKLGIEVVPGIAYRTLSIGENVSYAQFIIDSRNTSEVPRLNFSGALSIEHQFTRFFGISGGAGYTVMGWQTEAYDFTFGDMIDPRRGFIYATSDQAIRSVKFVHNFHYVDIPMRAQFSFGKKRFRSITSIGIMSSFLVRSNTMVVLTYADGSDDKDKQNASAEFNKIGLFPTFSTGVSYALNDRMDLRLEPTFRYGVLRVIEAPITANLWSGGIGFSFHYAL